MKKLKCKVAGLLLVWALPTAGWAQFTCTTNNGSITITGYDCSALDLVIPEIINGLPVTSIGDSAFSRCPRLTSVTIPDSVTSIGAFAFMQCATLSTILIPSSVEYIGGGAFAGCKALTSITIPDRVTSLRAEAPYSRYSDTVDIGVFAGCSNLKRVVLGKGLNIIGSSVFDFCTSLTSITVPDSVTTIEDGAFFGCTSLESVIIGNGVTSIGAYTFRGCTSLTSIDVDPRNPSFSSMDGVLFDKAQTAVIGFPQGRSGNYTLPDSVTNIGDSAFSGCVGLTSITIPAGVTNIGGGAFSGCAGLTSVTIPNSVTTIGDGAFSGCTSLTGIAIPDSVTSIGGYAFSGCSRLTKIYFQGQRPILPGIGRASVFPISATLYHLPGAAGWGSVFAGRNPAMWIPFNLPSLPPTRQLILHTGSPAPAQVRVQRSMDLIHWEDWQTVTKADGPSELHDADAGTSSYRFYRSVQE